jgi:hypothetical protein
MCTPNSLRFFNLYDKSLPENQTKRGEIDLFRTISKVLVYVFCSKRLDFRVILRNTLATLVDCGVVTGTPPFWRVRRPFGARGMSSVRYGTRLGDLKNKQSTHTLVVKLVEM